MSPPGRVLVTGANGFIAAYCIAELLSKGYTVVGTVRRSESVQVVLDAHQKHKGLSVLVVSDIISPTAFDSAIRGCDGVLHLAAPFSYAYDDLENDLLIPSIKGTESICIAATKTESVKRVVLTSSFAAIYDAAKGPCPGKVYTPEDWSPLTYEDGKKGPTPVAYRASKKLAEEAAWKFVQEKKPHWDLVTLCPGMVFGTAFPGMLQSLKSLNASNQIPWSLIDAKTVPDTKAPLWTSVTALARAHVSALEVSQASQKRFLVVNGNYDMQELADIIYESAQIPQVVKDRVPRGAPGERLTGKIFTSDSSSAQEILGVDLADPGECLSNTIIQLILQLVELEQRSQ